MSDRIIGRDLIPQPLKGEMKVEVQLPNPVVRLAEDLHQDRQLIGFGAVVLIGCLVAITVKHLLRKEE